MSDNFFTDLPACRHFHETTDPARYAPAPDDWYFALSDIRGSTRAIEAGRYKDVNTLGAATVAAVLNAVAPVEVPYVFGGDGATLLIPAVKVEATRAALASASALAGEAFEGLELRCALVPVHEIRRRGADVRIAKFTLSETCDQAMFSGGGANVAEAILKNPAETATYGVPAAPHSRSEDFAGLECRWSPISIPGRKVLSFLVAALASSEAARTATYQKVLTTIEAIYGRNGLDPSLYPRRQELALNPFSLLGEARTRSNGTSAWSVFKYLVKIWLGNILAWRAMRRGTPAFGVDWGRYRQELLRQTDSKKFDDTLRMVIATNDEQLAELEGFLQIERNNGRLAYGTHVSSEAIMTCLVFNREAGRHFHFVDGADGGYAMAAKRLKLQLQSR